MTPGYSPPEQYGTARTDQRSDIFSLGATLYAALTGSIPEDALARAMGQCELTPIRKLNPQVSRRLAAVIEKAIEVRPENRYATAEEFKNALLSVRGIPRRKTGEYYVSPPPPVSSRPVTRDDIGAPARENSFIPEQRERSPQPLLISTPLADSTPLPASGAGKGGRFHRQGGEVVVTA